ncbi:anti-sigma factor [Acidobacteria bacterium AB60]|nr:anti-sigma factor [Acidobacteria bacterium AB60]
MSNHLSENILSGLADGELSPEQLAAAQAHLDSCCACTSNALGQALLKVSLAKSGQRYSPSPEFTERLRQEISEETRRPATPVKEASTQRPSWTAGLAVAGWAFALVLLIAGLIAVQRNSVFWGGAAANRTALVAEMFDLHIAALAEGSTLQVLSSDRHTVKPWFQGRIPFTFNLPEQLPSDEKLDGANLVYAEGKPVAQLIYSIGHHKVSVFLAQGGGAGTTGPSTQARSGFSVSRFTTNGLEGIAISDIDPARLTSLVELIDHAQAGTQN